MLGRHIRYTEQRFCKVVKRRIIGYEKKHQCFVGFRNKYIIDLLYISNGTSRKEIHHYGTDGKAKNSP